MNNLKSNKLIQLSKNTLDDHNDYTH